MYDHKKIEEKWRDIWDKKLADGTSRWLFDVEKARKTGEKKYLLDMFPYPSGSGLHVGHVEQRAAIDIYARYLRMKGENVLMPTGYDSFGLPTENYAIKNNIDPDIATKQNTEAFHEQTKKLGISYDWTRELATSDADYYKFTQWWFKFLYSRGLAYKKSQSVNWCPVDQTVLANEQVIEGKCERCDSEVIQKEMEQWFFRITDYAERLLTDLEELDWPEPTKQGQRNWIGRSEGINIDFLVPKYKKIVVGTTNKEKVARVRLAIEAFKLDIEVLDLEQAGISGIEVEEDGDLKENAIKKAIEFSKHTNLPVLASDSGLFCEELEIDVNKVKRNALGERDEKSLNQAEIANIMLDYYHNLVVNSGKKSVDAEFQDSLSLAEAGELLETNFNKREIVLTDQKSEIINVYTPINTIYKPRKIDVFGSELDEAQKLEFLMPQLSGIAELLTEKITTFTTRPDTTFGATFIVAAPDSRFLQDNLHLSPDETVKEKVDAYIRRALKKTERERLTDGKKKTGEFTGLYAVNPLNGYKLPIYVSDFVLGNVGTGVVMGVPGHDKRDFEFAKTMGIEVKRVVVPANGDESEITDISQVQELEGKMINSDFLDGLDITTAKVKMMDVLEEKGFGKKVVNYKLRDWSISRQRFWGAPIPVVYRSLTNSEQELQASYANLPSTFIEFHAFMSSPHKNYHPWLQEKLLQKGVNVIQPELPGDETPELDEWLKVMDGAIESAEINSRVNTVISGRSLGGWAALKYAEKNKVRKLILVAPSNPVELDMEDIGDYFSEESLNAFKRFLGGREGNVDFAKVIENSGDIVIYLSTNDPYIPFKESKEYFESVLPNARIVSVRDAGHFHADAGYDKFAGLLKEILEPVRLDVRLNTDSELPVLLPKDADFRPKGTSPLGSSATFQENLDESIYGKGAKREIDTMDTFVCSSWYFFRFIDPKNSNKFADLDLVNKIGPVDFYIGGAEHTVLHLLYARFFTKVAYDAGLINFKEPFVKLRHQGLIMGPDNRKMSKRWGNVINPNDIVAEYGADTLRMYEMFMGPLDQMKAWNDGGVRGIRRFLQRIWETHKTLTTGENVGSGVEESHARVQTQLNVLTESIAKDITNLKFNTIVSDYMKFINLVVDEDYNITLDEWSIFLKLLYPFAPFLSSELWEEVSMNQKFTKSSHSSNDIELGWPEKLEVIAEINNSVNIVVTVNGKKRAELECGVGISEDEVVELAMQNERVLSGMQGGKIIKKIYIKDKLLNLVVK